VCGSTSIAKALASTTGWYSSTAPCGVGNNPSANNATGFSALPVGLYEGQYYDNFSAGAYFWSATDYSGGFAYGRSLYYDNASVNRSNNFSKYYGCSVRCVRD